MKNQKGYTGVDIAISVVVITIFIALIGTLVFNFNSNSNEIEYRSKALDLAINAIEDIKTKSIEEINELDTNENEITGQTGYYKRIDVLDAANVDEDFGDREKVENLVKKVTVTVSYKFRNQIKSVELSTIISKDF